MAKTYDPIATTILASPTTTITFSGIPSTYTDLRVVIIANTGTTDGQIGLQFNSSSSGYSLTSMLGTGGTSGQSNRTSGVSNIYVGATGADSNIFTMAIADVFNYALSTVYKNVLARSSEVMATGTGFTRLRTGTWANTSAITTLSVVHSVNFVAGTRVTIFGIKAA